MDLRILRKSACKVIMLAVLVTAGNALTGYAQDTIRGPVSWPYYKFIQYYPDARHHLWFGEVRVHKTDGTSNGYYLRNWDDEVNRPLYPWFDSLQAWSGSENLTAGPGDTLMYYWHQEFEPQFDTTTGWYNIRDTIVYYIDLVNLTDGSETTIDSLGTLPFTHRDEFLPDHPIPPLATDIVYNDTAVMKRYVIPVGFSDPSEVWLRVRPTFRGADTNNILVRWDVLRPGKWSEATIEYHRDITTEIVRMLDSINAKRSGDLQSNMPTATQMTLTQDGAQTQLTINIQGEGDGSGKQIRIVDALGRTLYTKELTENASVWTVNIASYSSGVYHVLLMDNGKTTGLNKFTIAR